MFGKKKRAGDLIDLRSLESVKRTRKPITEGTTYYDSSSNSSSTSQSSITDGSALGFLGDLAGAAQAGQTETSFESSTSSPLINPFSTYSPTVAENSDLTNVKDKVDLLNERIYRLIKRIELLEHKLARLERKQGY